MRSNPYLFNELADGVEITGDVVLDASRFLAHYEHEHTVSHSREVAAEAGRIARLYGHDSEKATVAGWLHDISAVLPTSQRIAAAQAWSIPVLPEEEAFPLIVHQKLSAAMAQSIFHIVDESVLSAIGCHTTLKTRPSELDEVLFVADKIKWDQEGSPPYLDEILEALGVSLDAAAFCYVKYIWNRRDELAVVHPWLAEAYAYLRYRLSSEPEVDCP